MLMKRGLFCAVLLILLLWLASSSVYTVDRTEFVYVTQFGQHVVTHDGATDAGLHFKLPWPIQSVQRLDHRMQVFDLPGAELLTPDRERNTIDKTLTVDAYVCWRIAGKEEVDQFIRTVGTPDRARTILGQRVSSRLGAVISNTQMDELISVAEPAAIDGRMDRLRERLLGTQRPEEPGLQELARKAYGIELLDIRLRRFNYPPQVRDAIFDRIRSERNKKVADYQSEGEKLARDITSTAEREASDILTEAKSQEQRLKRQADVRADDIRNQAHSKDPEFYAFLQKLEAYQRILGDSKDVLLLSSRHELFDLLLKPPRLNRSPSAPGPLTGPAPAKRGGQ